jgi:hypothetical protein
VAIGEGLAGEMGNYLRVVLGSNARKAGLAKAGRLRAHFEAMKDVAESADF